MDDLLLKSQNPSLLKQIENKDSERKNCICFDHYVKDFKRVLVLSKLLTQSIKRELFIYKIWKVNKLELNYRKERPFNENIKKIGTLCIKRVLSVKLNKKVEIFHLFVSKDLVQKIICHWTNVGESFTDRNKQITQRTTYKSSKFCSRLVF